MIENISIPIMIHHLATTKELMWKTIGHLPDIEDDPVGCQHPLNYPFLAWHRKGRKAQRHTTKDHTSRFAPQGDRISRPAS